MYWYTSIVKMENDEFENVRIENCTSYYFDDIIKLEDFDIDSILMLIALKEEKSNGKYYTWSWKIWCHLQKNWMSYKSKKWNHIYFSLLSRKHQCWFLWFFTYRKNVIIMF